MVRLFDSVLNLLKKPLELFFNLFEPYWDWLVKHDKWVYLFLLTTLITGALF